MRKAVVILVCLVLLSGGGAGLWFYGRPVYRHYKETKFVQRAQEYLAKGDHRNASLSARQTLALNHTNLAACRIMADLAQMAKSPAALDYRQRIAELEPTVENRLAVASAALRLQNRPYPLAAQVLDELRDTAQGQAAYHVVAAELALKLDQAAAAAGHFQQAARLEPTNELHQLNLAVLQLISTNASLATDARAVLERLRPSTNVGNVALGWLVNDSRRRNDLSAAEAFSQQLLADPRATLDDRLQHLAILRDARKPEFGPFLASVQQRAATNALQVYTVSAWLVANRLADDALAWLSKLPYEMQTTMPVPVAVVDCHLARTNWQAIEDTAKDQKWDVLEFLRRAFLSQAAAARKDTLPVETHWRAAVQEAGDRLGALVALASLADNWKRENDKLDLLWRIDQKFPKERWALRELHRLYFAAGNTRSLNRVYAAHLAYDPKDVVARNNLAATGLLLKANLTQAHDLARALHAERPDDAIVTSTYAYSLHLQGRTKEGLQALQALKPEALETPAVAAYYGVLLAAAGEPDQAKKYLAIAKQASLLPEEKALVDAAAGAL